MTNKKQFDLTELSDRVLRVKRQKAEAEAALHEINAAVREAEWLLISQLREQSIDGFKRNGTSFAVHAKLVAKRTNDDALFDWLENNGYGATVKRTVHHMTLNKICSETLEHDGALPAGVESTFVDVLSVRKA